MSTISRLGFLLGFVSLSVLAAEEPTGDLHPLSPTTHALFGNDRQFRMLGNNGTQAFSADGKTLFLCNHMGLTFWDLNESKMGQSRSLRMDNFFFANSPVALSPDGKTVAAASAMGGDQDMPIRFFDTVSGKETRQLENDERIQGLCFSPDGRLLAIAMQQRIELWDAANGDEVRVFPAVQNTFYRLFAFSPDGKMLAAVANTNRFPPAPEDAAVDLHIWETASGKERTCLHLPPPMPPPTTAATRARRQYYANRGINGIAFSVDGQFLAYSGNDAAVHVWDLHKDKQAVPLTGIEGSATAVLFTPDGKELIAMSLNGSRLSWKTDAIRRINDLKLAPLSESAFADLWTEYTQSDVFRSYRAGRHLLADPQRAVALMGGRLKPVPPGDSARLRKLVADLSNPKGVVRRKAMMELRAKHGEAAVGVLRQDNNRPQRNPNRMTFEQKLVNLYNTPERARDLKAVRILEEIGTPEARKVLEKLSEGAEGVNLTSESKAALERLAARTAAQNSTPDNLWSDLASDDAGRAYRAIGQLSITPKKAVPLLGERLKPVPIIEEKALASLLANLEADDFKTREQATESLEKAAEQAVPILQKALDGKPNLEARKRIEQLLERLTQQTPPAVLQGLRAIEVLENVGSAEAKHVLVSVSGGAPQALVTREAKASLQRLARR